MFAKTCVNTPYPTYYSQQLHPHLCNLTVLEIIRKNNCYILGKQSVIRSRLCRIYTR